MKWCQSFSSNGRGKPWHLPLGGGGRVGVSQTDEFSGFGVIELKNHPPSFSFKIWLTTLGLALPLVAFMTWPTKNPTNLILPFL